MTDQTIPPEPVTKRADQLVVGDRILPHRLPAPFFKDPGEVVFVKVHDYRKGRYVFVAYMQDNGFYDSTSYEPDGEVEVYPAADPSGQGYTRVDNDDADPQPSGGRIEPHFESGRVGPVVEVAGGLVEVDDPVLGHVPLGVETEAPIAQHYEAKSWDGGRARSGVECACGRAFDGYDSASLAAVRLRQHIAKS